MAFGLRGLLVSLSDLRNDCREIANEQREGFGGNDLSAFQPLNLSGDAIRTPDQRRIALVLMFVTEKCRQRPVHDVGFRPPRFEFRRLQAGKDFRLQIRVYAWICGGHRQKSRMSKSGAPRLSP